METKTLDLESLYIAMSLKGIDRDRARASIVGMMSAKLSQKDFEDILETIRVAY